VTSRTADSGYLMETFRGIDEDGDGRLTLREVFAFDPPATIVPAKAFVEAEKYLALDQDGDGKVTMAEVDMTSAAFLAEQTLAGVGPLAKTPEEDEAQPRLEDAVRCRFPSPTSAARIVRLGAREGGQLSSVALGGQDQPTYSVSVEIEPGPEPLYVVATSEYPVVWRLSGATERIEAFVASSRARDSRYMWPAVGVTGLDRSRFRAVPHPCFGDFDERNMGAYLAASEAARLVRRRLGRSIDIAYGAYQPQGVRLPAAQPFKLATEIPAELRDLRDKTAQGEWTDFLVHHRGGIATIEPRRIVTPARPERYQVYSYGAGLAQLLEVGAITPVTGNSDLLVLRPIRFPAGLYGGHSATFRLPDGVAAPKGNPGHSRVVKASNPKICLVGCR
jgi:hypothetical protein